MIKPVKMKKLSALILEEHKDAVLRELKEREIIQLLNVEESEISKDFDLEPGKAHGINVKAGEYLSKIEGMLEIFELAKAEENISLIKKLTQEPVAPVPTEEVQPSELFEKIGGKIVSLEEQAFGIFSRLEEFQKEKEEVLSAKDIISKLKLLNVGPVDLEGFESTFTATGIISSEELESLRSEISEITDLFYFHSADLEKTYSIALLVAWREFEADIRRVTHIHRFEEFHMPAAFSHFTGEEAIIEIDARLSKIEEEEGKLLSEIKKLRDAEQQDLLLMRESLQIEKTLDETNSFFGNTEKTFLLSGWVPADRTDEIIGVIERASDDHCITSLEDPGNGNHPPTLLNNSPAAKPMELLTTTYGTPSYDKTDPTTLMAISFPILFGLMFGDVGQGVVLTIVGYLLGFYLKLDDGPRKLGKILFFCGIAATFAGFLYGELFGLNILTPLWLEPMQDVMTLIQFAFFIAIIQLSLGCFINIADELSHGKPLNAIFSPWGVMGLWLFWGGAILLSKSGIDGIFDILFGVLDPALFVSSIKTLSLPLIIPLVMIVIGAKYVEGISLVWSIYEAYEAFTRFLFNSISYIRVSALAIVHAVFASVMVMGMSAAPTPLNWLIFIIGNIFILVFETLISFIQALRLHYYEWFSKFYEGDGDDFKAFKVMRKYTFLPSAGVKRKQ